MKTIIVSSSLEVLTPRVTKNAQALASGGHDVILLVWDRENTNPKFERKDGYAVHRFKFKSPYGPMVLLYWPVWWAFELLWLLKNRWDVVHAFNFDTVVPAVIAAKLKRRSVVYELADIYADMRPLPHVVRNVCLFIDKVFMRLADAMVIVEELKEIPNENTVVIRNSPPDFFQKVNSFPLRNSAFTIFYAAVLKRSRRFNLDKVYQAINSIDGVRLVIAGYGPQIAEIKEWVNEAPSKVEFIGRLSYTEVLERTMAADIVVALYDVTGLLVSYISPNKLFEAMMCGTPILVTKGTAMAGIVERENCGMVVDNHNIDEIREAISRLKDNHELCRQMGANGRKAYEQKYSWEIMEQRLRDFYQKQRKGITVSSQSSP